MSSRMLLTRPADSSLLPTRMAPARIIYRLRRAFSRRRYDPRVDRVISIIGLLDHLIRPLQERRRDGQAQSLRSLEINDQLELLRALNGEVPRPGTTQDSRYVVSRTTEGVGLIGSVGHQEAGRREVGEHGDSGQPVLERHLGNP